MASTWKTELQHAQNNVTNVFNNVANNIQNTFSQIQQRIISESQSFFKNGTSVVGIQVSSIPAMKEAIRNYVQGVKDALSNFQNYDPTIAFKGEHADALKDYISAIQDACNNIVTYMLAFNDQLTEVQTKYEAKSSESASAIRSDAQSTQSAYTAYTESSN